MRTTFAALAVLVLIPLAGCLSNEPDDGATGPASVDPAPFLGYTPPEPDAGLALLMHDLYVPGTDDVTLHARITRPAGDGPFPAIVQHTPYTAPGCNVATYGTAFEPPAVGCSEGTFETQFARRGYAYVHADLRGTGDSDGCLNLRGQADIADIGALADALAAQPWSNGNVGFIGASYPGSTSHMAALSGSPAVKAVVPVVASTSFYHYHHNSGVPYNGNHALGGTNTGYTQQGLTPTANPESGLMKLIDQPMCPHVENAVEHGGLDQSGAYYEWWQERNLRTLTANVTVPVLMAQGLADWNVKPDHVATWFNDIPAENKVFIGGQWGHAYPASDDGACPTGAADDDGALARCTVPWGNWWEYASAFFDTYLKGIDTGMFEGSVAWVQDNHGTWHRSATWPILEAQGNELRFTLHPDGTARADASPADSGRLEWYACPDDTFNRGAAGLAQVEALTVQCADEPGQALVFETEPFAQDTILSGVPLVHLQLDTGGRATHVTVVVDQLDGAGVVVASRENYGYLNTAYQGPEGLQPADAFDGPIVVDLYPQEDFVPAGHKLRITIASDDGGRTIEAYEEGVNSLAFGDGDNALVFPTRPADLWGTRLPDQGPTA